MHPTPITDENKYKVWSEGNVGMGDEYAETVVPVEIARRLENLLVEAGKQRDELQAAIDGFLGSLRDIDPEQFNLCTNGRKED